MQASDKQIRVAIPASVVSDTPHLREKTAKLGTIARACSIFGVHDIILYADPGAGKEDLELCSEILSFLETPPYLRKKLFRLSPTLRFTGILPPLQTPPHNVPRDESELKAGDMRDGVIVAKGGDISIVDAGFQQPIKAQGRGKAGERVTVRLTGAGKNLQWEIVESKSEPEHFTPPTYWGYRVHKSRSIGALLQEDATDFKVGTSRFGSPINNVWDSFKERIQEASGVLMVFGSPKQGLTEILERERLDVADSFDCFVNTVPNQHTATVRTEEALLVSLGLLNFALPS